MRDAGERDFDDDGKPIYTEADRRIDLDELFKHSPAKPVFDFLDYVPPGPVAAAFIKDLTHRGTAIVGPYSSGKTTAAIFKRLACGVAMPICRDGWRRDKCVVVRESFRNVEKTVLASWLMWFPKNFPGASWSGGNDRPAVHTLRFQTPDGVKNEFITEFIGLGGVKASIAFRGYEPSMGWVNETDLGDEETWDQLDARLGRYPADRLLPEGAVRPRFMIGDMNPPDLGSWAYQKFYVHPAANFKLYQQPSGFALEVENQKGSVNHKAGWGAANDPGNYEAMAEGKPKWFVKRYIEGRPGYSRHGEPVYEAFDEEKHVARGILDPNPELPIVIGLDQDLSPAAAILQPMPNGQVRWLDELFLGKGVGPGRFAPELIELLNRRYPGWASSWDARFYVDPAAIFGGDTQSGYLSWMESMSLALGQPIDLPANGSNEPGPRIAVFDIAMRNTVGDGEPGLLISRHCTMAIEAFAGRYRWQLQKNGERRDETRRTGVIKNDHANVMDAGQYALLGYRGLAGVVEDMARAGRPGPIRNRKPWSSISSEKRRGGFNVHQI